MYIIYVKEDPDFQPRFLHNPTQALEYSKRIQKQMGTRKVIIEKIVTKNFFEEVLGTES